MAGAGRVPKPTAQRRTNHVPQRGDWSSTSPIGWQHGPIPDPPEGLSDESRAEWRRWMTSWNAAHWLPKDLGQLFQAIRLYEQCRQYAIDPYVGKENKPGHLVYVLRPNPSSELRQWMDNLGLTNKGEQDRRWQAPRADDKLLAPSDSNRYAHLKVMSDL
jgi:hypothetical protein